MLDKEVAKIPITASSHSACAQPEKAPQRFAGLTQAKAAMRGEAAAVASTPREFPANTKKIRVLVADDHRIMRQGLAVLLASEPDLEVVGEAVNGQVSLEMTRATRPDVVVMDIGMPVMNGIEATRIISSEMPSVRVIGLSMHDEASRAAAMIEAGAVAYLNKAGASEELISVIRFHGRRH